LGIKNNLRAPKLGRAASEMHNGPVTSIRATDKFDFFNMSQPNLDEDNFKFEPKTTSHKKRNRFQSRNKSVDELEYNFGETLTKLEESKNKIVKEEQNSEEAKTSDSTPDKSMIDGENVFESYILPDIKEFQLDFRNKMIENMDTSHNAIRHKYLNKLTQKKVWLLPSDKPKTHQTCIIFDWDDTILCTTYLNPNGYATNDPVPEAYYPILKKLEDAAWNILEKSLEKGKVFIITNAAEGWVQFSSQKYMPRVYDLLDKLTVVSARSTYENKFPGNSFKWKLHAFIDTMKELEFSAVTNLVALGDSNIEMEASKNLALKFPRALLKTVKFREVPTPDELIKQLTLVNQRLDGIWDNVKNLTIRLERRERENSKDTSSPSKASGK
jgi:hypothetical protein